MGEPAKKRGAGKQLTKDDAGREEGGEAPTGSRPKADKGTMSARKVVKVKRAAKTPGDKSKPAETGEPEASPVDPPTPPSSEASPRRFSLPFRSFSAMETSTDGGDAPSPLRRLASWALGTK